MVIEWLERIMADLATKLKQATDTNFFDKESAAMIDTVFVNFFRHFEYVRDGQDTPTWSYIFISYVILHSLLDSYTQPPIPPPNSPYTSHEELAIYFLHPACPWQYFGGQTALCNHYKKDPSEFSKVKKRLNDLIQLFSYLDVKKSLESE